MSFWEGIDWSEVDMGCGKSIMGCPTIPDRNKTNFEEDGDRLQQQIREAEAKQIQDEEAKKVRKKYIIYGLIAVAGYFAYKKFKK